MKQGTQYPFLCPAGLLLHMKCKSTTIYPLWRKNGGTTLSSQHTESQLLYLEKIPLSWFNHHSTIKEDMEDKATYQIL